MENKDILDRVRDILDGTEVLQVSDFKHEDNWQDVKDSTMNTMYEMELKEYRGE